MSIINTLSRFVVLSVTLLFFCNSFFGIWEARACVTAELAITDVDGGLGDKFGQALALDGDILAVGAPYNSAVGYIAGAVFLYVRTSPGIWDNVFTWYGVTTPDSFGTAVDLSPTRLFVGAPQHGNYEGAVHVLSLDDPYDEVTKLTAATTTSYFGDALAQHNQFIVVGAFFDDTVTSTAFQAGAVFIFEEISPDVFSEVVKFNSFTASADEFGKDVDIYGINAIAGMWNDDDIGGQSGSAFVFTEVSGGNWQQATKLTAPDGASNDQFGISVSIYEHTAAVGSHNDDDLYTDMGSVYIFSDEASPGTWVDVAKIVSTEPAGYEKFGTEVLIHNGMLLVGAVQVGIYSTWSNDGAVYVFEDTGNHIYQETKKLNSSQELTYERFGSSIAMSGSTIVIGIDHPGQKYQTEVGYAYIYEEVCLECYSSPCLNGVCVEGAPQFICDCTDTGYEGLLCESEVDDCASSPCMNDGVCSDAGFNMFLCDCTGTGYNGITCTDDVDDCLSSPCENGGNCSDVGVLAFSCACASGWEGSSCQTDVDDCASSPCLNDGVCSDTGVNLYSCDCTGTGFEGLTCSSDVNDCSSSPCENGGSCLDTGVNQYECNCDSTGFNGNLCESDIDDCLSNPCFNSGQCTDTGRNKFSCDCTSTGFEGLFCESDIDDCLSNPCFNSGQCTDTGSNKFSCDCTSTGFEGLFCESDIDDCLSSPCMNYGTCANDENVPNSFSCACNGTGFAGALCEADANDCLSSPCLNNGTCSDAGFHVFLCDCSEGYTGLTCEEDADDCLLNPCQNEGTCVDAGLNAYACECLSTHTGPLCETLLTPPIYDHPPVEILLTIPAFVNSNETAESFSVDLKETLLPAALGGVPSDYDVTIAEYETSYEVTVIFTNPSQRDAQDIEQIIAADVAINERVDGQVQVMVVEDEDSSAHHIGHRWAAMSSVMFALMFMVLLM